MNRFLLRKQAENDLADIWRFTERRWNVEQADRYFRRIIDALTQLAGRPDLGRRCDEIRDGYRRYNVGSHVIFFRMDGENVDVVRILHARRDFIRHLPKA